MTGDWLVPVALAIGVLLFWVFVLPRMGVST
jgi:hypothetical protein